MRRIPFEMLRFRWRLKFDRNKKSLKTFLLAFSAFFSSFLGIGVFWGSLKNFSLLEASWWSYIWPLLLLAFLCSVSLFLFLALAKRMRAKQ